MTRYAKEIKNRSRNAGPMVEKIRYELAQANTNAARFMLSQMLTAPKVPARSQARQAIDAARIAHAAMHGGSLYIDATGHKWITPGHMMYRVIGAGYDKYRRVSHFEAIGNFAVAVIRYKGEVRRVNSTGEADRNGYPVIRFED